MVSCLTAARMESIHSRTRIASPETISERAASLSAALKTASASFVVYVTFSIFLVCWICSTSTKSAAVIVNEVEARRTPLYSARILHVRTSDRDSANRSVFFRIGVLVDRGPVMQNMY